MKLEQGKWYVCRGCRKDNLDGCILLLTEARGTDVIKLRTTKGKRMSDTEFEAFNCNTKLGNLRKITEAELNAYLI